MLIGSFSNANDKIDDVHTAQYEWFMLYNSISDEAKNGSDCYATLDKIRKQDPNVPGTYIDLSNLRSINGLTGDTTVKVEIKLRIPSPFGLNVQHK